MTTDTAFWVFYWLVMANLLIGVPALVLMSLGMPDSLRISYYRQPYFQPSELAWLSRFPLSVFNDVALASMFVWPRLAKKRGVVPVGGELPQWLHLSLRVYFAATVLSLSVAMSAGGWLLIQQ